MKDAESDRPVRLSTLIVYVFYPVECGFAADALLFHS